MPLFLLRIIFQVKKKYFESVFVKTFDYSAALEAFK